MGNDDVGETRGPSRAGSAGDRATATTTGAPQTQAAPRRPGSANAGSVPPQVAGYDLLRVLGTGAMGVVWEAFEHRFDRRVALKVHAEERPRDEQREQLWAEALVAARIGDPGIVRVLDVGYTLDERPYYAMELVPGSDLAAVLADGPLAPRRALSIAADIARAVAAAHEHGVIHRDLKPRNVIIDETGRARIVDFGIAFVLGTERDRYAGQLIGSPAYMAPEQVIGDPVDARTDVFAIGVILHEMLTGHRPFVAETTDDLLVTIATQVPATPSSLNPAVHEDLDAVVARCLVKDREGRFATARSLFETLSAIAEGRSYEALSMRPRPSGVPRSRGVAPEGRPRREDAKKHMAWSWRLASSPAALWPHVADTDRFNRAVGLAPVSFTDEPRPEGGALRTGEVRVMGMQLRWRELPFEWVKERAHSVFRWYQTGPVAAVWNRVTLEALPDGGTELHHDVWITPRGVIGQVASFMEMNKLGPAIDRFYRHLDAVLRAGAGADPFEAPYVPTTAQRAAIDAHCSRLHDDGFPGAIVEKLAMLLATGAESAIATLRPFALADAWRMDRAEVLATMMHAAHRGLLEATWDVVCPRCMVAHESVPSLAQITRTGTCEACASSFERDLRESVELVFTPHPSVRRLERLTYCAGSPALRPHVLVQQVLDPGEERVVTVTLPRGAYRVAGAVAAAPSELVSSAVGFEVEAAVVADGTRVVARPTIVRAGVVDLRLRNDGPHEETFRVEIPGARGDAVPAAAAMTHPSFRSLFADQLLAHGEHLRVSQLAFVFVELVDRVSLFEELGDARACAELSRVDEAVHAEALAHEGILVPSSLELMVVALVSPTAALQVALGVRARLGTGPLASRVGIAVHDGRCLALTRDGKAEFFGETLHRGHALVQDCPPRGIALSASFAADRAVAIAIHESGLRAGVRATSSGPYAGRRVTVLAP